MVTFTYDIDGILHVSARSSGGDCRDRLILNPRLHLTEEEQAKAMERIQQIQLAAQGSQRDQLLLERGLRLYEQTRGQRQGMLAELISFWKALMDQGDRINLERNYETVKDQLDRLETELERDPWEDLWDGGEGWED